MSSAYHGWDAQKPICFRDPKNSSSIVDKRHHERYLLRLPITLSFVNGEVLHGFSLNASLGGFFVIPHQSVPPRQNTAIGMIRIGTENYSFPCQVTRRTHSGFGISVSQSTGILGYIIMTHIYNNVNIQQSFSPPPD